MCTKGSGKCIKMTNSASEVAFLGNVKHKLDPKSRVAVPADWRTAQGSTLRMLAATSEGYPVLKCYTEEGFADKISGIRQEAKEQGATPVQIDHYIGVITGQCFVGEVSTQGKLLIPKAQRERLRLADQASIVGRGSYFEIWNPEDFDLVSSPEAMKQLELDKLFGILS